MDIWTSASLTNHLLAVHKELIVCWSLLYSSSLSLLIDYFSIIKIVQYSKEESAVFYKWTFTQKVFIVPFFPHRPIVTLLYWVINGIYKQWTNNLVLIMSFGTYYERYYGTHMDGKIQIFPVLHTLVPFSLPLLHQFQCPSAIAGLFCYSGITL